MSDNHARPERPTPAAPRRRRPYEKPAFVESAAFERLALSCGGELNASPFQGCALKS